LYILAVWVLLGAPSLGRLATQNTKTRLVEMTATRTDGKHPTVRLYRQPADRQPQIEERSEGSSNERLRL